MVGKYTRETNRGQTSIDVQKRAAGALRQSGKLRQSAQEFNVSKTTLKRFVDQMSIDEDTAKKSGYKRVGDRYRIFSTKMEEDLGNHIKSLSNMFYGLSTNKCRQLAFEFAMQNNITIPDNWKKKRIAGIDWFYHLILNMDYLCESLKQYLSHVQQRSIATLLANFLINSAICMIATNFKCTIFTT